MNLVRPLTPYLAVLDRLDWTTSAPQFGGGKRLVLDWVLPQVGGGQRVRDYVGIALGMNADGPSLLRRLLNAIAGAPAETEVSFFDDENLEWGYQGVDGPAFARLQPGAQVTLGGEIKMRGDRQGYFFNPTHYFPPQQQQPPAPPPAAAPVPAPPAPATPTNGAAQPAPGSWPPPGNFQFAPQSIPPTGAGQFVPQIVPQQPVAAPVIPQAPAWTPPPPPQQQLPPVQQPQPVGSYSGVAPGTPPAKDPEVPF